ncbi:NfeD family protein [Haloimpatiens lingqiaonensis]|uniref:NfeD family protein n=1 Tax=Haloimpatiens lingqiaonensis TaxID=1380675 RepID=UPI0010FEB312|nr:NfeD family protein [Haloimpatiens lingqiaonensis]
MDWFLLVIWLIVGIGTLLIDILTSAFLFVWFTAGAIAAIICLTLGLSFSTQLIVFIVVSALFMGTGYPIIKKNIKKTVPKTKTMEEGYIGRELLAENDIEARGNLKLDGIYWTVENKGEYIKRGDKLKIIGIEGNKLIIQKIKKPSEE